MDKKGWKVRKLGFLPFKLVFPSLFRTNLSNSNNNSRSSLVALQSSPKIEGTATKVTRKWPRFPPSTLALSSYPLSHAASNPQTLSSPPSSSRRIGPASSWRERASARTSRWRSRRCSAGPRGFSTPSPMPSSLLLRILLRWPKNQRRAAIGFRGLRATWRQFLRSVV